MLQQTGVATVERYFRHFTERWPDLRALAAARDAEIMAAWAGLGYYARARNLIRCARQVAGSESGRFPETRAGLLKLPGIGPYTAAAISAIAFGQPETVVDGNVERVISRLFAVRTPLPKSKPELHGLAAGLTPARRPGDYAQAVMDLGATICTPRNPDCGGCPWGADCRARSLGIAPELPGRVRARAKPTRRWLAYAAFDASGRILLERRPPKGLLGGMLGLPGNDWSDAPELAPPLEADWHRPDEFVRHTFTHFHLLLEVRVANVGAISAPTGCFFADARSFRASDLPTVMRKAYELALKYRQGV